jgi:protein involved in sex pheromone biosynthesis
MKKTIFLSAAALALILGACNRSSNSTEQTKSTDSTTTSGAITTQTFKLDTTKLKSGNTFYQCEMDPEVLSDKPGNCPTCEMSLSEIKKK